jgi:hypothetical protein
MRDVVGGVGDSAAPVGLGSIEEPPSLGRSGRLVPARPLAQIGGEAEDQARAAVDR